MYKNNITTESSPPSNSFIDTLSHKEALSVMLENQAEVIPLIYSLLPEIEEIVHSIYDKLNKSENARLIYAGAGTSARIGVQDGVELYPTFGWPLHRLEFIIAGGKQSLTKPIENAEDNIIEAKRQFKEKKVSSLDVVIGLSASGSTPYTREILKQSKKIGALSIAIFNNKNSFFRKHCDKILILDTGYEIVTGSTRLKAGTSQKICLNLMSTLLMTMMGRVKHSKMINLVATNEKLRKRKLKIESS